MGETALDGIDWSASSMQAAQRRLEISAENLANASTDGFAARVAEVTASARGLQTRAVASARETVLRPTGRDWDLALTGPGTLHVAMRSHPSAVEQTRGGPFFRDADGYVVDERGRTLVGAHGFVRVPDGALIERDGAIKLDGTVIDRVAVPHGAQIVRGTIETSNVDSVGEMVRILDAQRTFETSEKVLVAIDTARQKAVDDVGVVKQ